MVDHSFLIDTGELNLTSPTFLESSFSTKADSTENLSPASNLSAGQPTVLPPASSTLYQVCYLIGSLSYDSYNLPFCKFGIHFHPKIGCGHSWKCYILCLYPLIPLFIFIPFSLKKVDILLFLI